MVLWHVLLPLRGPLQGLPYMGGHRRCHRASSAECHASKAGLGLRALLASGLAWLAWVAGFELDLAWLGLGLDLA